MILVLKTRHHGPSDGTAQPFPAIQVSLKRYLSHLSRRYTATSIDFLTPRFTLLARNHVKEILPKLNLPDHRSSLKMSRLSRQRCQGRLLASFQDDANQSQKEKAQDQRSQSMKEQAFNKDKDQEQDSRSQRQSNLKKPKTMF
ncbi:hypothetical protein Tco_0944655 [Tanacetum coccineum]